MPFPIATRFFGSDASNEDTQGYASLVQPYFPPEDAISIATFIQPLSKQDYFKVFISPFSNALICLIGFVSCSCSAPVALILALLSLLSALWFCSDKSEAYEYSECFALLLFGAMAAPIMAVAGTAVATACLLSRITVTTALGAKTLYTNSVQGFFGSGPAAGNPETPSSTPGPNEIHA